MNSTIAIIASLLGIAVALCTIASFLLRAVNAIHGLRQAQERLAGQIERESSDLRHELEKQTLTINGYRERVEHVNLRLTNNTEKLMVRMTDVENFLQKTTAFEYRSNR